MYENLKKQLRGDEGERQRAYKDSRGYWTIGVGHLIDPSLGAKPPAEMKMPNGVIDTCCTITVEVQNSLLDVDIARIGNAMFKDIPWAEKLDDARQGVLLNMAFNMGWDDPRTPQHEGLSGFVKTLALIKAGKWDAAADAMLKSKWAGQVGKRSARLAQQMRTGAWQYAAVS